ncbi:MBOAT-domain-containing protein [Cylindrobasidium torrendii FP15055 ss-10]|uniref:O-acyltransferase n=1 Tax=Cylindrobasidium torrendii FP15055 ss-10 TaxID=1314674 RepID=A0A0D7AWN2_9AGAR|nr:MBOAT-domain-containing protein [Cylindrobasidium torrendii FP15055 ss-10]
MAIEPTETPEVTSRTPTGGFNTAEGTIHVSKPFRSRASKRWRALVTFTPRISHFDINNERSGTNEFRGFFTLFWISVFLFMVRTFVATYESSGSPLNFRFAALLSKDAITLAISDAVLVCSTAICVPFAKAVSKGWIRGWSVIILQHTIQTAILFTAILWTLNREWPWVQSGFFSLHALVMIMKMHSYLSVNTYMQSNTDQSQTLLDQLRHETERVGGWEAAMEDAKSQKSPSASAIGSSEIGASPMDTPPVPVGAQGSYMDAGAASELRKRLLVATAETTKRETLSDPEPDTKKLDVPSPMEPRPLVNHPDATISELASEYSDLQGELRSPGPLYIVWPNNITFKNFVVYMLIPTLVYELEYPRTERIRPLYVFEKTTATFGTFALLYSITETFIMSRLPTPDDSFLRSLLELSLPFMICYLLVFYIIFECICNGFAELSYFSDRQFYEDWWNSTSWDEFSRKWNKPVHQFLLRHVYASSLSNYGISRWSAMFLTFLLSACVHELVMVVVTHKFRMYLFLLQLIQIPLIAMSRTPFIKGNKLLGNLVFWLGLYAGFPLLCVAYVAY